MVHLSWRRGALVAVELPICRFGDRGRAAAAGRKGVGRYTNERLISQRRCQVICPLRLSACSALILLAVVLDRCSVRQCSDRAVLQEGGRTSQKLSCACVPLCAADTGRGGCACVLTELFDRRALTGGRWLDDLVGVGHTCGGELSSWAVGERE